MKQLIERFDARLDAWGSWMKARELRIPSDLTAGILFFLVGLVMLLLIPGQIAISESDVVNGRAFPSLLMVLMMVCCAVLVGRDLYKLARKQPIQWKTVNLLVEVKALVILLILLGTYALSRLTGLFVIGGVFCCLGFLAFFRCKKWSYYGITIALAVTIWCAFRFGLGVRF